MRVTLILLTLSAQCVFVAAGFSDWTTWSKCKCDQTETRSRECLSEPCIGPEEESRACVCTPVDLQDKCSHVCVASGCVSGHVTDPCDCSCFYHCVKAGDQWTATQQCCNLCEVWDDYPKTCVRNSSDPDCTFTPLTNPPGVCPLSSGSSNTKFFLGGVEMSCGPNTEFSQADCACVHAPSALPLEDLITCITFDGPRPYGAKYVFVDKVEIETDPGICNVSGNCGYFDSRKEAHLEIPFFAGNQFSKFAYSFWYRRNPNNFGKMGLVNNGNCEVEPTISLVSGSPGYNCGQLITEKGSFYKNSYQATDGDWHMYTMTYDGSYVSVYLDTKYAQGKALTGLTKISQCPMTIGSYLCADFYDGHMDSISFFRGELSKADVQSLYDNRGACSP